MPQTETERAIDLLARWAEVATRDNTPAGGYGVKVTPKGRYTDLTGSRIGHERAIQIIVSAMEDRSILVTPKAPRAPAGPMTWEKLNPATQEFFFKLAEDIQTASQSADMSIAVRLGHDIPKIRLQDAPRLSNLKKAGLIHTSTGLLKSHKMIVVTEAGLGVWADHL